MIQTNCQSALKNTFYDNQISPKKLRVCPREDQADGGTVEITDFAHISPKVALW